MQPNAAGIWQSTVSPPTTGWTAFFMEIRFSSLVAGMLDYRMTSEAIVVRDYPFEDCQSESCTDSCGTLQLVRSSAVYARMVTIK